MLETIIFFAACALVFAAVMLYLNADWIWPGWGS